MLSINLPAQVFTTPGLHKLADPAMEMLRLGKEIRDKLWMEYPLLPFAVNIYMEMVASREWRVSGPPRGVVAAIEAINDIRTYNTNGMVEYGFEQFLQRIALDNLMVGRCVYHWDNDGVIEYLDPTQLVFDIGDESRRPMWRDTLTQKSYSPSQLVFSHPIPIGRDGRFLSPVYPLIPTATFGWLIREHDIASADGRKLRDIFLVHGEETKTQMAEAIIHSLEMWSGLKNAVEEHGVATVTVENLPPGVTVKDLIHRIGLANIPDHFDARMFEFRFANEIAGSLGLSMRHFYNLETGTNRALEEVQEARQVSKGPAYFIRSHQRTLNRCGFLKQFGKNIKLGFVEEVDSASREVDARVVNMFMDAFKKMMDASGGQIKVEAVIGWFQKLGFLPADVDFLVDTENGEIIINDADLSTPGEDTEIAGPDLDAYEEHHISMTLDGEIIERRRRYHTVERELRDALIREEGMDALIQRHTPPDFVQVIIKAKNGASSPKQQSGDPLKTQRPKVVNEDGE